MWSASRPCPHASWNRIPPLPPGQHHRQLARGCRSGRQLGDGPGGSQLGQLLHRHLVEQLESQGAGRRLEPGLEAGVTRCHTGHRKPGADLLVAGVEPFGVGDEDPAPRAPASRLDLGDGAVGGPRRLVGPSQQVQGVPLGGQGDPGRPVVTGPGRAGIGRPQGPHGDRARPTAPAAGHGRGRLGRSQQAGLGEVGGVGESGGVPRDHPDAGTALASRGELLDPPVVQQGRRGRPVLGEDLGEVTAVPEGLGEHPLEYRGIDHHSLLAPLLGARWPMPAASRIVPAWLHAPVCRPESN